MSELAAAIRSASVLLLGALCLGLGVAALVSAAFQVAGR